MSTIPSICTHQRWRFDAPNKRLVHVASTTCLDSSYSQTSGAVATAVDSTTYSPMLLLPCTPEALTQMWQFI